MRPRGSTTVVMVLGAALALSSGGCAIGGANRSAGDRIRIVTGLYPLQYLAEQIGGDRVSVTNLGQPGVEPHDLELSPRQMAAVADADLVLYVKGFQPALDEAISLHDAKAAMNAAVQRSVDPHLWLDPNRLAVLGDRLADRLAAIDPDRANGYRSRSVTLQVKLRQLDREYQIGLRTCERREMVVSHAAFGYLAQRYDLDQVPISGLSPDVEPTPRQMAQVAQQARTFGATTIFFESLASPRVAQAIATEVGASTAVLDPIEGLEPGSTHDYLSLMRANLAALRPALGCS